MSSLTAASKLVRLPDLVASEMDGDLVMMSIEHGSYFGISGVGTRVWALLEQPISIVEISAEIGREFDVDAATCEADMLAFAEALLEHGVARLC